MQPLEVLLSLHLPTHIFTSGGISTGEYVQCRHVEGARMGLQGALVQCQGHLGSPEGETECKPLLEERAYQKSPLRELGLPFYEKVPGLISR